MNEDRFDLRATLLRYSRILRRQWWVIAGTAAAALVATILLSATGDDTLPSIPLEDGTTTLESASVSLTLREGPFTSFEDLSGADISTGGANVHTESQLIRSVPVAEAVADAISQEVSVEELLANVSVAVRTGTEVIDITYLADDIELAQEIATAFATSYVDIRKQQAREASRDYEAALKRRIKEVKSRLQTADGDLIRNTLTARLFSLEDALSELRLLNNSFDAITPQPNPSPSTLEPNPSPSTLASPPALPSDTSAGGAPSKKELVAGFLLGLFMGIGLALLRESLDDLIHDREEVEALGIPVLGDLSSGAAIARATLLASARVVSERGVVLLGCGIDATRYAQEFMGDVPVVAAPSILDSPKAIELTSDLKAVALLVAMGTSTRTEVARSIEEVRRLGGTVLGALLV